MRLLFISLLLVLPFILECHNLKKAGIYIRLNQKAVNYIAELASEALPHLLNNLSPADTVAGPAKLSKTIVHNVTKPETNINFVEGKGFRADIVFPYIKLETDLAVSVFIFEYSGNFQAFLHDLTLSMELHYSFNDTTGRNVIEAPHCSVNHSDLVLSFPPHSQLATIRQELEDQIISKLRSAFCEVAVQALQFVDDQNVQEVVSKEPTETDAEGFNPAELGYSICKAKAVVEEDITTTTAFSTAIDEVTTTTDASNTSAPLTWGANLSMAHPPIFRSDDVVVSFNGGVLVNGEEAVGVDMPKFDFNRSIIDKQMLGIAITEFVPNTLFSHFYDHDLGQFEFKYTYDDMPKNIKKLIKAFCSKCYLRIAGQLVEKPLVQIDKHHGIRTRFSANFSVIFQSRGNSLYELFYTATTLHATIKPIVRHSRVYGDVSLTGVDVNFNKLAVTGIFTKPIERAVGFIVPKVLWPQVKKRFRLAMNRRGIQLPIICGVEFDHMNLFHIDHAIILTTDFTFDLPMFVEKFKQYLQYKASLNPLLPKYIE